MARRRESVLGFRNSAAQTWSRSGLLRLLRLRSRLPWRWPTATAAATTRLATTTASRCVRAALAVYVLVLAQVPGYSNGAQTIHLKGRARIEAHAARYSGEIALAGTAIDDTGLPAPLPVTVTLSRVGLPGDVVLTTAAPESCSTDARHPPGRGLIALESATRIGLPSDADGRFCVRLLLPTDRYVAHFVATPSPLLDGATLDLAFDVASRPVTLRFAPAHAILGLAIDDEPGGVDVFASTDTDGTSTPVAGLKLRLANEMGAAVGDAITDAAGRGRFSFSSSSGLPAPASRLGPAGRGELTATFDGDGDHGPSTATVPIERRTHVRLLLPQARDGVLPPGSPEDGIAVKVRAVEECAARGCAGEPSGIVEARVGGNHAGAAALVHGEALVVLSFAQPEGAGAVPGAHGNVASVQFQYLPDAPWFLALPPAEVLQPVRVPTPWGRIASALAGLAVLAWFVQARVRPMLRARLGQVGTPGADRSAAPAARVVVVRPADGGGAGWRGVVVDAHDRQAVAGAIVSIERRSFERATDVVRASSDATGAFDLPFVDVVPGDQLTVNSRLHANFRTSVPPQGSIEIAVTLRKRALIEELVAWARRKGGAYDLRPDATPGHVRLAAIGRPDVARWADAVEHAAFGPSPVDAQTQSSVDLLAPADARRAPQEEDAIGTDHVDGPRPRSV